MGEILEVWQGKDLEVMVASDEWLVAWEEEARTAGRKASERRKRAGGGGA